MEMLENSLLQPMYDEHKSKKRSLVWNFFVKISQQRVKCRLCDHEQNYQGTTGNILRHLKSRHNLDLTLKGQQDPENQRRIKELSGITEITKPNNITIERKPNAKRSGSTASDSTDAQDPYHNNDDDDDQDDEVQKQDDFSSTDNDKIYEKFPELEEHCLRISNNNNSGDQKRKSARRTKLEEDRILAETLYFREKAAYFRLQKHLTALQAKKIKLEINQMDSKNQS